MSKESVRKQKVVVGLKKARTSLDRILDDLENIMEDKKVDDNCFDVIQQNLAVIGLLKSVNTAMLEGHLESQLDSIGNGAKQKRALNNIKEEIIRVVQMAQSK